MSAVQPSDEDLIVGARAIARGLVLDISTAVHNNLVYSYIRLHVDEVFKGKLSTGEVVLKQPGGVAGDLGTMIYGMPRFETGQQVFVYLDTWADGALRVHQWFLGKYDIRSDPLTGKELISRGGDEAVSVVQQAGAVATLNDTLDAYRAMVKRLLKANRERARSFEQAAYGDTPILAEPAEFGSLQTAGQVAPQWTTTNGTQPPRWFEADGNQWVTFYVNAAGAPVKTIVEDTVTALNAWAQSAGTSLRLNLGGETSGCGIQTADGQNTISFSNCDNYFSPSPGCSGILATGGIVRYTPSQSRNVSGMTFYKAIEANVAFNPYALCNFTNRQDLIETLTHEIGHALGLGHSTDPKATMYNYAQFDNRGAGLMGDDLQGIRFIYPVSGNSSEIGIRTNVDLPPAQAGQSYQAGLVAAGGSGDYTWTVVVGQLPDGFTLSADGTLSGVTDSVCLYNFIVQARDAAGRVSQMPFALPVQISSAAPVITGVEVRKKKMLIYGANFTPSGAVYLNDALIFPTVEAKRINTGKIKLKSRDYTIVVKDSSGRQSNRFIFTL